MWKPKPDRTRYNLFNVFACELTDEEIHEWYRYVYDNLMEDLISMQTYKAMAERAQDYEDIHSSFSRMYVLEEKLFNAASEWYEYICVKRKASADSEAT